MISICVPIYNFDVAELISALNQEIKLTNIKIEIICIDDFSDKKYRDINKSILEIVDLYIELDENIGRSSIRNKFLDYAKNDYLLFLDCDSKITSPKFIRNYLEFIILNNPNVVCGGRIYPPKKPTKEYILNWKYGIKTESKTSEVRKLNPNKSFMTNNFAINAQLFKTIKFDEKIKLYGHEDTLFGIELKNNNIVIDHIENPVLNGDLIKNDDFLIKTKHAIINLLPLINNEKNIPLINNEIKIIKYFILIKKYNLKTLFISITNFSNYLFYLLLKLNFASLFLFNIYKLHFLIKAQENKV